MRFLRPALIVGALPVTLTNGTTADATQVMSDLNWLVNQVNANAAPLATAAVTNANNNFSTVQSGQAATQPGNFPTAGQVQNNVFNTLSSILGTNTITARVAALTLGAYAAGQVFTFIPSNANTGPVTLNIDGAGPRNLLSLGSNLFAGQLSPAIPVLAEYDGAQLNILSQINRIGAFFSASLASDVHVTIASGSVNIVSLPLGSEGTWFVSGALTFSDTIGGNITNGKIWDGTNVVDSRTVAETGVGAFVAAIPMSGIIANPNGGVQMAIQTFDSGLVKSDGTAGQRKETTLSAFRIA